MTLQVSTARLSRVVIADGLDITRMTADREAAKGFVSPGAFLAPSRELLTPALRARERAKALRLEADRLTASPMFTTTGESEEAARLRAAAEAVEADAWAAYEPRFLEEKRRDYARDKRHWTALLARESVTFRCACPTLACHRRLVAEMAERAGATIVRLE